jgi:hypothetical protein
LIVVFVVLVVDSHNFLDSYLYYGQLWIYMMHDVIFLGKQSAKLFLLLNIIHTDFLWDTTGKK